MALAINGKFKKLVGWGLRGNPLTRVSARREKRLIAPSKILMERTTNISFRPNYQK